MKAKLLTKVRSRFDWYYKKNGDAVLIDHKTHKNLVIDVKCAMEFAGVKTQDELLEHIGSISIDEYLRRVLMYKIITPFGISYASNLNYRFTRKYWKKRNNKRRTPDLIE